MTDPIKALIAAAEAALAWMDLRDYEEERDLYPRRNLRYAIAAAKAAAEARPEPAPAAPSRWDYVHGACYCRVCKQEADECECEPARPEPAAEPSRISHFRIMLDNARAAATSGNPGAMLAICDAVEALAREVRRG